MTGKKKLLEMASENGTKVGLYDKQPFSQPASQLGEIREVLMDRVLMVHPLLEGMISEMKPEQEAINLPLEDSI